ncbi:Polyketide transferase [Lachnellula suecica]|uniref:Polyketide transferase n=1 Tax=Lachnellula suecica TaxID=602035 RepID=A0A8T9CES6_9HELO|nr:Polyketide transferase [Lachnellula suecica]
MAHREDVEFKTLDGLTLRAYLFPAMQKSPAIIMTPGFNCTKDMFVAEVAEHFQTAGFTVLLFDPRSIGASDGMPRNEVDPFRNAEDYHDALTFLKGHPMADSTCIAFWGWSFSAMVALTAAALDKRVKAVVAVSPVNTSVNGADDGLLRTLTKCMKDRESQLSGNEAFRISMLLATGDNPGAAIARDPEVARGIEVAIDRLDNFDGTMTLKTHYYIAAWQPMGLLRLVSPTPVMIVIPEEDTISPPEEQKRMFGMLSEPRHLHLVPGKGHMDLMNSQHLSEILEVQIEFLRGALQTHDR